MRVFTTMRPWEPLEVDAREAADLRNMGLLVENESEEAPALAGDGAAKSRTKARD